MCFYFVDSIIRLLLIINVTNTNFNILLKKVFVSVYECSKILK